MSDPNQNLDDHERLMRQLKGDDESFLPSNNRIAQFLDQEHPQVKVVATRKAEDVFPMGQKVKDHLDEEFGVLYETLEDGTTIATIL
tara:strand:- start:5909 stop:6169 length:261 start_codon:yes stop_codon:yes gene_type:complete